MRFPRMIDEARPDIDHRTEKEEACISTPADLAIIPLVHALMVGKLDAIIPVR
jgi:hypothetical protein